MKLRLKTGISNYAVIMQIMVLWLGCIGIVTASVPPLVIHGDDYTGNIAPYVEVFEDPQGEFNLDQVIAQGRFVPAKKGLSFGFSPSVFWLRFTLENQDNQTRTLLLQNNYALLDRIALYQPDGEGFKQTVQGDTFPYADRQFLLRDFLFEISIPPLQTQTLYIQVNSTSSVTVDINYYAPHVYYEYLHDSQAYLGIFYGICLGLFAYNLFLYFSTRERAYLFYLGVVSSHVYIAACFDGLNYRFLPEEIYWQSIAIYVGICCNIVFSTQFCRVYLCAQTSVPRLNQWLYGLSILGFLELVVFVLLPTRWLSILILVTVAVSVVLILATGVARYRQHYVPARLFLLSWSALLAAIFVGVLNATGILNLNELTPYLQKIGVSSEMIILSIALGNRINLLKRAEQVAIENMHKERVLIIKQANESLESKVAERTIELERALNEISVMNAKLKDLSALDGLTGLYNRRHFEQVFHNDWQRCSRVSSELSIVVIDVDHFKRFNDTYGHLCGDECLRHVAQVIQQSVRRDSDTLARYGGEEFTLIMPHTPLEGASCVAERIRENVEQTPFEFEGQALFVTVSLGGATTVPHRERAKEQLFNLADQQLYQAKHAGRNRFVGIVMS